MIQHDLTVAVELESQRAALTIQVSISQEVWKMHDCEAPFATDLSVASGGSAALTKLVDRKNVPSAFATATYQVIANKNLAFSK